MTNLLTKEEQQNVVGEYHRRLVLCGSFFSASLLLAAIVTIIPFYFSLDMEQTIIKNNIKVAAVNSGTVEFDKYQSSVSRAQNMLSFLSGDHSKLHAVSSVIDHLNASRPAGIKLTTVDINKVGDSGWAISLRGLSLHRQDILNFVAALGHDPLFMDINSPISNLVKDTGGEFIITLGLR